MNNEKRQLCPRGADDERVEQNLISTSEAVWIECYTYRTVHNLSFVHFFRMGTSFTSSRFIKSHLLDAV